MWYHAHLIEVVPQITTNEPAQTASLVADGSIQILDKTKCARHGLPSIALNQIVELADAGLLFADGFTCKQKFRAIVDKLGMVCISQPDGRLMR